MVGRPPQSELQEGFVLPCQEPCVPKSSATAAAWGDLCRASWCRMGTAAKPAPRGGQLCAGVEAALRAHPGQAGLQLCTLHGGHSDTGTLYI